MSQLRQLLWSSILLLNMCFLGNSSFAQGLENVIVERYYVDAPSAADTTFRVYLDLAPGYKLLAVFGYDDEDPDTGNSLSFSSSTGFYNDAFGATFGSGLNSLLFAPFPDAPLDTYICFGAAATDQFGIPKAADTDGSNLVPGLTNIPPDGISPTDADGFTPGTTTGANTLGMTTTGASTDGANFIGSSDGTYFVLGGVVSVAPENTILIGQFTTDGDFEFEINIQIQSADGTNEIYVHTNEVLPDGSTGTVTPTLKYPIVGTLGCTNPLACNYDENATLDDGSCLVPEPDCTECNATNDGLILIDDDGDGVCNADEVLGCTNPLSCNYNSNATEDDGSCTEEPEEDCSFCLGPLLELIDSDGDGICDANEIPGCTNPLSCNYNENATDDDGSCTEIPEDNCTECQEGQLVLIDSDGDGICDADEIPGCTNPASCNFNEDATDDDGSCIVPIENCSICNDLNDGLVLIDDDSDGVCNAEDECPNLPDLVNGDDCVTNDGFDGTIANCQCETEIIAGCINPDACNYNPNANLDDGSCIVPVENCTECNDDNDGLDLIDSDGDGICDADEIPGCTNPLSCNYNPEATDDDGSCTDVPEENCTECDGDELILIDSDGDGICDADEIPGCTNPLSCNYNPEATDDDGSCTDVPEEDCTECDGDELILIDSDGDGICDGDEIPGCTNPLSCNYNPEATDDDGSCTDVPEEDCTECDGDELILIDSDGDGICDGDEIPGCTDPSAVNFNADATDDDGSCIYEASISLLELECEGQVIQVTDAQSSETPGGLPVSETRTIYVYELDGQTDSPTYTGTSWPYVRVPGGYTVDGAGISAEFSTNSDDMLLVNNRPAYQYTGDQENDEINGAFGLWSYLLPNGEPSQDACNDLSVLDYLNFSENISIFPNPARTEVRLRFESHINPARRIKVSIYNILGAVMEVHELALSPDGVSEPIHIAHLNQGVYLFVVESENGKTPLRLIKN